MSSSSPTNTPGRLVRSKDMRILVTGSSGQLGATIAEQLSHAHEPLGIDIVPGKWTQQVMSTTDRTAIFQVVKMVDAIIHTASLHHPHLETHARQAFIDTNISGTLNLLEAAIDAKTIRRFVYTSTTSVYGRAMVPAHEAVWVTEELPPQPRDIYDISKLAAEELCRDIALSTGMPTLCLRVARFFAQTPELLALYRLYRGVDVRDAAAAHVLAATGQEEMSFEIMNISAHSPFLKSDLPMLLHDAASVLQARVPHVVETFARHGWQLPGTIDRVYVTEKAERLLGYRPVYGFDEAEPTAFASAT
jgi:UDP-glucose 4-epimerase